MDLPGLEHVHTALREPLRHYAARIHEHGRQHVQCLTLYGAVAGPAFDPTLHTVSNVLVLDTVDLGILRRLAVEGHRFGKGLITAPLVMTPEFLRASRDTFPLELIEIQQQRLVLFGEDLFAALEFEAGHVRLQCERELKVLALAMRHAVVAEGGSESHLRQTALRTLRSLVRVMRGMLWLKNQRQAVPATGALVEIENLAGRHLPGIRRAMESPSSVDWLVYEQLYSGVEVLGQIADGW